jgi:sugar phosphate permease
MWLGAVLLAAISGGLMVYGVMVMLDGSVRLGVSTRSGGASVAIGLSGTLARLYGLGLALLGAGLITPVVRWVLWRASSQGVLLPAAALVVCGVGCIAFAVIARVF